MCASVVVGPVLRSVICISVVCAVLVSGSVVVCGLVVDSSVVVRPVVICDPVLPFCIFYEGDIQSYNIAAPRDPEAFTTDFLTTTEQQSTIGPLH